MDSGKELMKVEELEFIAKNNYLEHKLAEFSLELLSTHGMKTAIGPNSLKRILELGIKNFKLSNPYLMGSNMFSFEVALGLFEKYHIISFYSDNIEHKILESLTKDSTHED